MAELSKIEWCDHTFNPWMGCTKVSEGCKHCYAEEQMDHRYKKVQWGPQGTRVRTAVANWKKPLTWNRDDWRECQACGWRGSVVKIVRDLAGQELECPVCSESEHFMPARQRIFCASLADVFEDRPELVAWRGDLFNLIQQTPNLDWLLLTKRPENVNRMVADYAGDCEWLAWDGGKERRNIWLGTSVENQEQADRRIPFLIDTPARVKFLSMEPLLGEVDLRLTSVEYPDYVDDSYPGKPIINLAKNGQLIDWVIVGGESGKDARPMSRRWVGEIRDQCMAAGVPFLFKQWGEWLPCGTASLDFEAQKIKGATDWSARILYTAIGEIRGRFECRVLEGDTSDHADVFKVGKHLAGRLLDGREWNEFPKGAV